MASYSHTTLPGRERSCGKVTDTSRQKMCRKSFALHLSQLFDALRQLLNVVVC